MSQAVRAFGPGGPPEANVILKSMPHPVLLIDRDKRIEYVNDSAQEFFAASSAMLLGHPLNDIVAFGSPVLALIDQVFERGVSVNEYGVEIGTPRIGDRQVDIQVTPLNEYPGHVLLLLQVRTMAQKMDRQLTHRGAARSVTGMAAILAHEIKNPLSGIRGAAQLLEQSVPSDEVPLARLIREETDRIVGLIDRVEVFGDERPMEREPINIHVVLDRVKLLARNGVARGITFYEEYDPSLPPVFGNRDQLIQIFLNLIKNASEALERTQKPEIKISTAFRPGIRISVAGVAERISLPLEIVIEDNGPGVPPDILPFLFDPFVTTKTNGSGLGLALVAKIVGEHGGVIECETSARGATFRVLMPAWKEPKAATGTGGEGERA